MLRMRRMVCLTYIGVYQPAPEMDILNIQGATICAERTALVKAVVNLRRNCPSSAAEHISSQSDGARSFVALAVTR